MQTLKIKITVKNKKRKATVNYFFFITILSFGGALVD